MAQPLCAVCRAPLTSGFLGRCGSFDCAATAAEAAPGTQRSGRGPTLFSAVFAVGLVAVVAALAAPNLTSCHRRSNDAVAIGALKTIATSESIFREGDKEEDGNLDYGTLAELSNTRLVDSVLGGGTKQGYTFAATYSHLTSEFLWFSVANPVRPGTTGDRYFETNQAGVIFYTTQGVLALDTSSCSLPNNGVLQTGR